MTEKIITRKTRNGVIIKVDTSRKACLPFGFFAGDKVKTPEGLATVIGVADGCTHQVLHYCSTKESNLWFHINGDSGACYWGSKRNKEDFEKAGFKMIKSAQSA